VNAELLKREVRATRTPSTLRASWKRWLRIGLAVALLPAGAFAAGDKEQEERIKELERKVEVLSDEVEKSLIERVVPDVLESAHGLGPAASKVYHIDKGLSIGGYGEALYTNQVSDGNDDRFDFVRFVTYIGYKFTDKIILNSEIEFEHATTGEEGSVSVEFATLDFMLHDAVNLRAGLVLVPMGFINEMHEPVTYFGNHRPEVERRIVPSTWRAGGGGFFGRVGDYFEYKLYTVNGFNAANGLDAGNKTSKGFDSSGLRGGRQKGSKAFANTWAIVGRVDTYPIGGLNLGGSFYYGNSGQDQDGIPPTPTTIWEIHTQYEKAGARFRGLMSMAYLGDTSELSDVLDLKDGKRISSVMLGGYAELGYNVLPHIFPNTEQSLEPFYRFEYLDTQRSISGNFTSDPEHTDQYIHTVGISYKPIPQVVIKVDYRNRDAAHALPDEVNIGFGFVF